MPRAKEERSVYRPPQNCWEFVQCGREPGGTKSGEMGICPAAIYTEANGYCSGVNGGRCCVYIKGTFCQGEIAGTFEEKASDCLRCDFYHLLKEEDGAANSVMAFEEYVQSQKE